MRLKSGVLVLVGVIVLLIGSALAPYAAEATVVNFDDLLGNGTSIDHYYAGLTWSPDWYSIDPTPSPFQARSMPTTAFLNTLSGTVQFPSLVNFDGLWISSLESVQISGGGYSTTIAPTLGAFITLDWQVNDLTFVLGQLHGAFFDDFTYTAVPIPPGAILLATGLLSLGFGIWRRS